MLPPTIAPVAQPIAQPVAVPVQAVAPTESVADIINRIRRENEVKSALARQAEVAQGTALNQGALTASQGALAQQTAGLDPRFGALKGSAVAGTRVAQNRLQSLLPFTGQQAGRGVRQAQGLETDLSGRQSGLDLARSEEEADIAFRGQQAIDRFNTSQTALEQGATAAEIARNIRTNELADSRTLDEARFQIEQGQSQLAQQQSDFLNTINRFSQDYQAQINAVQGDGDPSNDWQIPYLQAARQDKIAGIQQNQIETEQQTAQDTLSLAQDKWNAGIPLTQQEAVALGVPTGATKPRPVSATRSGSTGGFTQNQLFNNAQDKIKMGIPLSEQEALAFGVDVGYVDPSFGATSGTVTNDEGFSNSVVNSSIKRAISTATAGIDSKDVTPRMRIDAVVNWIVDNADEPLTDAQQDAIIFDYQLSDADLAKAQRMIEAREQFDPNLELPRFPILPQ